jgi:hypothetical protein
VLRFVLVLHRWLGVAVGTLMTVWCLSGFVMMYVDYPRLTPEEQLRGLAPVRSPDLAALARVGLPGKALLSSVRIEMMAGRPVLRVVPAANADRTIAQTRSAPLSYDLVTAKPLVTLTGADIRRVAETFGAAAGIAGTLQRVRQTDIDQWTVQTFRRNQPLYRADFSDPAGTVIYIAGNSGEVVQQTTRHERFWGWLGAVPHWLYPTILRQNGAAWSQVVIWTSLIGCFLTVTGLWVGVARLRRRRDAKIGSPYKGLWWWHHVAGLCFGVVTLTWVASGLFSMNPWGFLDSRAGIVERQRLAGEMRWDDVRDTIASVGALPPGARRLEAAPLGSRTYLLAIDEKDRGTRFGAKGRVGEPSRVELMKALHQGPAVRSLDLLTNEDAYYYGHKGPVRLPVWRAVLSDGDATRLYIDPRSGMLIRAVDRNGRRFRWLQDGLHRLDLPVLRTRPLWDGTALLLLAAVTLVCGTGTWMGYRKVRRDVRRLYRASTRQGRAVVRATEAR